MSALGGKRTLRQCPQWVESGPYAAVEKRLRAPSMRLNRPSPPCEWDEADWNDGFLPRPPARILSDQLQLLNPTGRPHGNHHSSAGFQLIQQRCGHVGRSRRDDDPVKWGLFGPAGIAVTVPDGDIDIAQVGQPPRRLPRQRLEDFDRVDMTNQSRKERRLVARPSPDFEHHIFLFWPEQMGHERDQGRLRNGLVFAYRQWFVFICEGMLRTRDEKMAG